MIIHKDYRLLLASHQSDDDKRNDKGTVLMTRNRMGYAKNLYEGLGYHRIENYPPYEQMEDAICYAKELF